MGQVTDLAAVATVQVKGIDTKRVNFRLRDERVENSPLPLALFDQKNEKKIMTKVRDDWDVVDVRCISELLLSVEIPAMELSNENSSDGFATPNVERKEDDLDQQEMTSTSKKLCRTIVKKEKIVK
ncbi:hypothetical protein Bca4012_058725 [Brassica carinata]